MERRLAAILAADVVGYSRFMERDEAETLALLKTRARRCWSLLIEFASAVIGGRSALLVSAHRYQDIQRAILHKFLTEISGN
jgi:class 3 adenylate cyclase